MNTPNRKCLILIITVLSLFVADSQLICQNCVDVNSNNFTCNNVGCNGFTVTPVQNASLNFASINCLNGNQCYYTSQTPVANKAYVVYLFCNYTFPGCANCQNGATCNQCQNGYFNNVFDPALELLNCQLCESVIGGC